MIQLYFRKNEDFTKNGDRILSPRSAVIKAQINGAWTLSVDHPIDPENKWQTIVEGAVLKVPSFDGTDQLYRITTISKSDSSLTATAEPIFMDSANEVFIMDNRAVNVNGSTALSIIFRDQGKYAGTSDIGKKATAYYVLTNPVEAIQSNNDNSFINRWGGEVFYDNYTIRVNGTIGKDNGVKIMYGKNIVEDGLKETVDVSGVVTRLIPQAFNGYRLEGNKPWIDSPLLNSYPIIYARKIEFPKIKLKADISEGEDTSGLIICNTMADVRAALRAEAQKEFDKGIDKPKVSIDCKVALLANTEEYKDYKKLERVSLGDVVHCKHSKLGIVSDARVTALSFDCIRKAVTDVTIGEKKQSFISRVSNVVKSTEKALTADGNVKADKVSGFINGALAQLRLQNTIAKRENVRAILFEDLDPSSPYFGAMSLGTQGFQISRERTQDRTDWIWSTFGTAAGFNANFINAGEIHALTIEGSTISGTTIDGSVINGTTITGSNISTSSTYDVEYRGGLPATVTDSSSLVDGSLKVNSVYSNFDEQLLIRSDTSSLKTSESEITMSRRIQGNITEYNYTSIVSSKGIKIQGYEMVGTNLYMGPAEYTSDGFTFGIRNTNKYIEGYYDPSLNDVVLMYPRIFNGSYGGDTHIADKSIASGTSWVNLGSFYLPLEGIWDVIVYCRFASNATGKRAMRLSTSVGGSILNQMSQDYRNAVSGSYTNCMVHIRTNSNGNTQLYVDAFQNSGGNLSVATRYSLLYLGPRAINKSIFPQ